VRLAARAPLLTSSSTSPRARAKSHARATSAYQCRAALELRLGDRRLEELDRVARGVLHQDLLPPDPGHDRVAQPCSLATEPPDQRPDVVDLDPEPIPPPVSPSVPTRHGLATARPTPTLVHPRTRPSHRIYHERALRALVPVEAQLQAPRPRVARRAPHQREPPGLVCGQAAFRTLCCNGVRHTGFLRSPQNVGKAQVPVFHVKIPCVQA